VILSSRRFVPGRLFDRSRHFPSQNAARPGERFERLPRRLVITFAGQGSAACIDSGLVHGATPSGRPIIQQLKGFPGASNSVGESESNEDRDWPGELSAVHDNLQSELKDGGRNMHGALGNVRVGPLLQYHHANVGLCVSAVRSARNIRINQDASLRASDRPAVSQHTRLPLFEGKNFQYRDRIAAGNFTNFEDQRVQSSCPRSKGDGRESGSFRTFNASLRKVRNGSWA
jgi:hypothetical protein